MDAATTEHVISQVGRVLDAEVTHENRKHQMGLADLKARLAHITGIESLTAQVNPDGTQTFSLGEQTVEIPAGNAAKRNRVHRLAEGLATSPQALARVDEAVAAIAEEPTKPERTGMSITGLKSGAFHGTIEALRQRLIDKQSQGAAKIAAAGELGAAKIDEAVNSAESKIDKEVSDVLQDFSEFTNGGPA